MFKPRWSLLALLIAFATGVKLFPYLWMEYVGIQVDPRYSMFLPWNFAPLMAITLFAGAYFRNAAWGPLIPLSVLAISDLGIFAISGNIDWAVYPGQIYTYGTMLFCGLFSLLLRNREQFFAKGLAVAGIALVSETIFFLVTNAAVWRNSFLAPQAYLPTYEQNFSGLMQCYAAGFPFYLRSLVSTAIYGTALFYGYKVFATAAIPELQSNTAQPIEVA